MNALARIPHHVITGDTSRKIVVNKLTPNLKGYTKRAVENVIVPICLIMTYTDIHLVYFYVLTNNYISSLSLDLKILWANLKVNTIKLLLSIFIL